MPRSEAMQSFVDGFAQRAFGRKHSQTECCVTCGSKQVNPETDFRDELSVREYGISHMCQKCQDKVFGTGDE